MAAGQASTSRERGMNARLDETTSTTDPVVRGIVVVTLAITIVGMLALVRAAVGGSVDHVTVRIDNQAGLAVQVDALDAAGDRVGLGQAKPTTLTTFQEIPDIGPRWTLVATYAGQEAYRQTLARTALAAGNWTVTIPASATSQLERAGFR
jgi:catechol 2,3-dioxygenase-like lactoylglutathione lyase family enzyme